MPVPRGEGNCGWAPLPLPHFLPFSSRRAAIIGWGCGGVLDPRTILAHSTAITRTGRQKNKRFNTLPLTTTNFQGSSLSRGSRPSIPLTSATRPEQGLGRRCDLPYEKDKLLYMQALSRHVGQGRTDSLEPPSGTHATPRSGPTQATPVRPTQYPTVTHGPQPEGRVLAGRTAEDGGTPTDAKSRPEPEATV